MAHKDIMRHHLQEVMALAIRTERAEAAIKYCLDIDKSLDNGAPDRFYRVIVHSTAYANIVTGLVTNVTADVSASA